MYEKRDAVAPGSKDKEQIDVVLGEDQARGERVVRVKLSEAFKGKLQQVHLAPDRIVVTPSEFSEPFSLLAATIIVLIVVSIVLLHVKRMGKWSCCP